MTSDSIRNYKTVIRIVHWFYKLYWRVFKPNTQGARALLIKNNQVLLVEHVYTNSWYLPGGGVKKGEEFEAGLRRELMEELGITVNKLLPLGIYENVQEGKRDLIKVFYTTDFIITDSSTDIEVSNYRFFDMDKLPSKVSPGTKRRVEEYILGNQSYSTNKPW